MRSSHPLFEPIAALFPKVARLTKGQPHNVGNFLQGETREVVHVHNARGLRVRLFQLVHQQAYLNDAIEVGSVGARIRNIFIQARWSCRHRRGAGPDVDARSRSARGA